MRRVLAVLGMITLGVVIGFLVRLLWPQRRLALDSYGDTRVSAARRTP